MILSLSDSAEFHLATTGDCAVCVIERYKNFHPWSFFDGLTSCMWTPRVVKITPVTCLDEGIIERNGSSE